MANETKIPLTVESAAYKVLYSVLNCRNTIERGAYCYGTLRRPDAQPLRVGLDWALERGLVQYGTTNASARAWSRGASDEMLYLTKAGRAWVRQMAEAVRELDLQVVCATYFALGLGTI